MVVDGRQQRQAARAAKRAADDARGDGSYDDSDGGEVVEEDVSDDNAANFPSLECLALPYHRHVSPFEFDWSGDNTGRVSGLMMAELRRSYEYEVSAEWEAECTTLGVAELLKTIMA